MSSWEIMLTVYGDEMDTRLRRAADGNVRSHLSQLVEEGRITEHPGRPRRAPSEAKRQREIEHVRERERMIKQARRIEAAQRREQTRQQENPPSDLWSKPPLYGLS